MKVTMAKTRIALTAFLAGDNAPVSIDNRVVIRGPAPDRQATPAGVSGLLVRVRLWLARFCGQRQAPQGKPLSAETIEAVEIERFNHLAHLRLLSAGRDAIEASREHWRAKAELAGHALVAERARAASLETKLVTEIERVTAQVVAEREAAVAQLRATADQEVERARAECERWSVLAQDARNAAKVLAGVRHARRATEARERRATATQIE